MEETDDNGVVSLETLCVSCFKNGTTKLLLTSIPNFREVIIGSFECPHCGYRNREVQSGSALAETGGCRLVLSVVRPEDLNRQVVKAEYATISIPEVKLEIPPVTQRGVCSTVEGVLRECVAGLRRLQKTPETAVDDSVVEPVIAKLETYASGSDLPFTFILDDPAGNSFIEPYSSGIGKRDPQIDITHFERTTEQLHSMGFYGADEAVAEATENGCTLSEEDKMQTELHAKARPEIRRPATSSHIDTTQLPHRLSVAGWDLGLSVEENVARLAVKNSATGAAPVNSSSDTKQEDNCDDDIPLQFNVQCPHCGKDGVNEMCQITIPGFRKCLIMAFICNYCGSRSNEVKPMGAYGEKAKRWTLRVVSLDDLNRDILKSDTASVMIPELDLEMCMGTLGGVFTTVEGLLQKIVDNLSSCSLFAGDSASPSKRQAFQSLLDRLSEFTTNPAALPFTLIVDDAADLSMISGRNPSHALHLNVDQDTQALNNESPEHDAQLTVEVYERSQEQNDDLGITGMRTEDYDCE